jgi:ribose/xylose/arabinose/galactoside ABC-type transport system permease subunit
MSDELTPQPAEISFLKRYGDKIGLAIAWLALTGVFWALRPQTFLTPGNVENMMRQTIVVSIAAIGMTWIIARGAIDLSVGSIVALTTVIVAKVLGSAPPLVACAAAIGTGMLCGLINGLLASRLKVGAFIITLAGMLAYRGIAKGFASDSVVNAPETWIQTLTKALGPQEQWMLIPRGAWIMLVLVLLSALAMKGTVFGRRVIAAGSNENTARLCGIDPDRMTLGVFVLGGALFGIAGLVMFSRLGVGDPTVASGLELTVIAAVVIGGASLSGGTGSTWGAFLGALIMQTISTGCSQLGLDNWVQDIITGAIIVLAVSFDRWRVRRAATG